MLRDSGTGIRSRAHPDHGENRPIRGGSAADTLKMAESKKELRQETADIRGFTLMFDNESMEVKWNMEHLHRHISITKRYLFAASMFQGLFYWADAIEHHGDPTQLFHLLCLRTLLGGFTLLACFLVSTGLVIPSQMTVFWINVCYGIPTLSIFYLARPTVSVYDSLYLVYGLCFFMLPKISPLNFIFGFTGAGMFTVLFIYVSSFRLSLQQWLLSNIFIMVVVLLFCYVSYSSERVSRERWLLRERLKREKINLRIVASSIQDDLSKAANDERPFPLDMIRQRSWMDPKGKAIRLLSSLAGSENNTSNTVIGVDSPENEAAAYDKSSDDGGDGGQNNAGRTFSSYPATSTSAPTTGTGVQQPQVQLQVPQQVYSKQKRIELFFKGIAGWALCYGMGYTFDFISAQQSIRHKSEVNSSAAFALLMHSMGFSVFLMSFTGQIRWLALNGIVGLALMWVFNKTGMDAKWVVFSTHSVGYVLLAAVIVVMILVFGGVVLVWSHLIDFLKDVLVRYPQVKDELSEKKVLEQVLIRYIADMPNAAGSSNSEDSSSPRVLHVYKEYDPDEEDSQGRRKLIARSGGGSAPPVSNIHDGRSLVSDYRGDATLPPLHVFPASVSQGNNNSVSSSKSSKERLNNNKSGAGAGTPSTGNSGSCNGGGSTKGGGGKHRGGGGTGGGEGGAGSAKSSAGELLQGQGGGEERERVVVEVLPRPFRRILDTKRPNCCFFCMKVTPEILIPACCGWIPFNERTDIPTDAEGKPVTGIPMCTPYTEMIALRDNAIAAADTAARDVQDIKISMERLEVERNIATVNAAKLQGKSGELEAAMLRLVKTYESQLAEEKKQREIDVQSVISQHNHQLSELKRLHKALAAKVSRAEYTALKARAGSSTKSGSSHEDHADTDSADPSSEKSVGVLGGSSTTHGNSSGSGIGSAAHPGHASVSVSVSSSSALSGSGKMAMSGHHSHSIAGNNTGSSNHSSSSTTGTAAGGGHNKSSIGTNSTSTSQVAGAAASHNHQNHPDQHHPQAKKGGGTGSTSNYSSTFSTTPVHTTTGAALSNAVNKYSSHNSNSNNKGISLLKTPGSGGGSGGAANNSGPNTPSRSTSSKSPAVSVRTNTQPPTSVIPLSGRGATTVTVPADDLSHGNSRGHHGHNNNNNGIPEEEEEGLRGAESLSPTISLLAYQSFWPTSDTTVSGSGATAATRHNALVFSRSEDKLISSSEPPTPSEEFDSTMWLSSLDLSEIDRILQQELSYPSAGSSSFSCFSEASACLSPSYINTTVPGNGSGSVSGFPSYSSSPLFQLQPPPDFMSSSFAGNRSGLGTSSSSAYHGYEYHPQHIGVGADVGADLSEFTVLPSLSPHAQPYTPYTPPMGYPGSPIPPAAFGAPPRAPMHYQPLQLHQLHTPMYGSTIHQQSTCTTSTSTFLISGQLPAESLPSSFTPSPTTTANSTYSHTQSSTSTRSQPPLMQMTTAAALQSNANASQQYNMQHQLLHQSYDTNSYVFDNTSSSDNAGRQEVGSAVLRELAGAASSSNSDHTSTAPHDDATYR